MKRTATVLKASLHLSSQPAAADATLGLPHELYQVLCVIGRNFRLDSLQRLLHLKAGAKKQKVGLLQSTNLILGDSGSAQSH